MVAAQIEPQRLSARDNGSWGPLQIATPAIVGGVLLLAFVAYFIWQRNQLRDRPYDYHPVRSDWVTKIERIFIPRRRRMRVLHSSAPISLDDSMHMTSLGLDFRRIRQYRSNSSDSQTPLTVTTYPFDYPRHTDSPSPMPAPKRPAVRWWRLFGSRPREVKPQEPSLRWRIDGPDGSSTGHGHSSHGHEDHHARFAGALEAVREDQEETADDVVRIGDNFANAASTPMTQHFTQQTRDVAQGMPAIPEYPGASGTPSPVLGAANMLRSSPGTPVFSANRGLPPPSYDVSQSQTQYVASEDVVRVLYSSPRYMVVPPPVRTAAYSSPRSFHERELSTDSFLAAQSPMVATSIY